MSTDKVPQPLTIVDRAINALTAFGVTTERDAGRLLPMWMHYGDMSADDRVAVFNHYRSGGAS